MIRSALMSFFIASIFVACAISAPSHRGPMSAHFDGERFRNQIPVPDYGFSDFLRWRFDREPGVWNDSNHVSPGPAPPERVGNGDLRVTFVNHSTVLIQMDSLNILTDPIWSDRAGPFSWAGPKRVRPPGIRFEDLPPIDVVILSHNHYDHTDIPTLKRLFERDSPRVFVALGNRALMEKNGIPGSHEMDWWQDTRVTPSLRLTFVPAQHFSARGLGDRNETLWGGYVLEGDAGVVYFAGDTGWGPQFEQVRDRFGAIRLAILPIGAFRPRWFMAAVHISPEEAVHAHQLLGAGTSMGVHFGTFRLGDDGQNEPAEELANARELHGVSPDAFWVLGFGEGRMVPPVPVDTLKSAEMVEQRR